MGFFDGILHTIGQVASVAAPFLPGPLGSIAGIAGGLINGANSQHKADQATGQMTDAMNQYAQNARGMLTDPSQYYQNQLGLVGRNNAAIYNQGLESTIPGYNSAADQLTQDAQARGIGGGALAAQLAHLRMQQGQANSGIMRDIGINNQNQAMNIYNQMANAQMMNRQMGLGAEGNIFNAKMGTLGGLQGMYANQANQAGNQVGGLLGTLGQGGVWDLLNKPRTGQAGGSNTAGSTTAQSPSPIPWQQGDPTLWNQQSQSPTLSNNPGTNPTSGLFGFF